MSDTQPVNTPLSTVYDVPTSLSPSRVESFLSCPMAFRFASIQRLPEPPSVHTTRGSFVHRVLELLFTHRAAARTMATAETCFQRVVDEYATSPDLVDLGLDDAARDAFHAEAWALVGNYFTMEDPTTIRDIGLELRLDAAVGDLSLRGIIDRLELTDDNELIVTDYKTGRSPGLHYEQNSLAGVQFYSFLCNEVLGRRPIAVRLMYLRTGETITATPSAQSVKFITTRTTAVWKAIGTACRTGDFRPRQGKLCGSCAFQQWCPAFGGNPDDAEHDIALRSATVAAA